MSIIANGDTFNYDRGGVPSTAEMVTVVGATGEPISTKDALVAATDLTAAVVNIATATDTTIVTATASQTTRVHRVRLNVAAAQQITVKSAATVREVLNFTAAGFLVYDFSSRPWWTTVANEALVFTSSTTGQVHGVVEYVKSA